MLRVFDHIFRTKAHEALPAEIPDLFGWVIVASFKQNLVILVPLLPQAVNH